MHLTVAPDARRLWHPFDQTLEDQTFEDQAPIFHYSSLSHDSIWSFWIQITIGGRRGWISCRRIGRGCHFERLESSGSKHWRRCFKRFYNRLRWFCGCFKGHSVRRRNISLFLPIVLWANLHVWFLVAFHLVTDTKANNYEHQQQDDNTGRKCCNYAFVFFVVRILICK